MSNCCLDGLPEPQVGGPATNPFVPCADVPLARLCHSNQDRETQILCAPDGTKVAVQSVTPEDAPTGTAPVFETWLLDGTAWVGDITTLTDCATEKIDVSSPQWFCHEDGYSFTRTDFWDTTVSPPTLVGSLWQDTLGAIIPAPLNDTYIVGACQLLRGTNTDVGGKEFGSGSFASANGDLYYSPNGLFGFTVVVLEAGTSHTTNDYVRITFGPLDSITLLKGDVRSWEAPASSPAALPPVVQANNYLTPGVQVQAFGNAKFQVLWVKGQYT